MTQPNQDPLTVLAQALHGEIHDGHAGPYVLAPGPGHSPDDRSLSVSLSATAPDGFVVFSHYGDDWRECRDHVRAALNGEPLPDGPVQPAKQHKKGNWKSVWFHAKNPLHHIPRGKRRPEQKSPVELYLNSRGLELTTAIADEVVRFDPACGLRAKLTLP
jgi:putative DNA primase/helicase